MPSKKSKKRKRDDHHETLRLDTSKPSKVFEASGRGRHYTLSIAVPGSIIANAQNHESKSTLAGQIGRAAAVFCVDEIVVYSDQPAESEAHARHRAARDAGAGGADDGHTGWSDPDHFLAHVLSFLECPPFLRKSLFPMHANLRAAGSLPSLDLPSHARPDEWTRYRDGVALAGYEHVDGALVNAGLKKPVELAVALPPGARVTLRLPAQPPGRGAPVQADAVAPSAPREEAGFYWGYAVRQCASLSAVFTESPYEDGYDVSIGTSERGRLVADVMPSNLVPPALETKSSDWAEQPRRLPSEFRHLIICFGGVAGLEAAASADPELRRSGITAESVGDMFDSWVNVCPGQGSRTIRCEEAIWLGLASFKPYVDHCGIGNREDMVTNGHS